MQFPHLSDADAAAAIAAHIRRFWEPRMLAELADRPDAGLVSRAATAAWLMAGQP